MKLSPHNTVAVGDAENDLSLFGIAEIGAAVADAVASVRRSADLVLDKPDGAGVAELLSGPYLAGYNVGVHPAGGSTSARSTTQRRPGYPEARAGSWSPDLPRQGKAMSSG
ncbi:haloacid dehalogenase-like hydrolase family protein [Mycobacterium kansasii]|uniref:Haloacid dehalogenase-like hydrolase family protein n=1 Tax=Mycobacterium kansasii TaxID=1768 RepID=A0A1V3WGD9_MYCKA|nr:haloacid dehalogenase-like hydrolase family protein [Mycobacterium kansasii]